MLILAVMVATMAVRTASSWLIGRDRPKWQTSLGVLDNPAFPSGHASHTTAFAGLCLVLAVMLVRRANIRRLIGAGLFVVVLVVCADRVLLGRHYWTDIVGGVLLGAGLVLLGVALYSPLPRSIALTALPLPQAVPSKNDLAVVLNPIKVEDVEQFQVIVNQMAHGVGVEGAAVVLHDRRGLRHRPGRAGVDRRRRPGGRVRRRRHRARGVRRAGRHRHPGRDRARRHRQPARPQPRHPALHPGRDRHRDQRPGPCDRHGEGDRRRPRGHPLHGDGRHGLRRRDHGGRQRGDQGEGRLAGLRALGAEGADVPDHAARGVGRRRPVHQAQGADLRRRQRRQPAGRHEPDPRRRDRRRPARRRPALPAPVPQLDPARGPRPQPPRGAGRASPSPASPAGPSSYARRSRCRASSTATSSRRARSCTWSASTAGCWCGSRASHAVVE